MKPLQKTIAVGASSLLAVTGIGGMVLALPQANAQDVQTVNAVEQQGDGALEQVRTDRVDGIFTFTQDEVDSNDDIRKNLGEASKHLCGANPYDAGEDAVQNWSLEVKGAVEHSFTATFDQLEAEYESNTLTMGCSCAGNPSDGRASVNAEVTGIPLMSILKTAGLDAEANTIVFASADGYEVSLPLSYVMQKYCTLVFDINGAPIAESVGGVNQLWLGSTAASYFARDIASITLEQRETPPPSPSSEEARASYANLPNIGVVFGGEVA